MGQNLVKVISKIRDWAREKRKIVIPSAVTIILIIIIITFKACSTNANKSAESIIKAQSSNLIIQGSIETDETTINTKIAGNIESINVSEGDKVKKGDVLMKISSEALLAKKAQADAAVAAATGQVNAAQAAKAAAAANALKAQNGAQTQDIAQAKAAYDFALQAQTYANDSYNRIHTLYQQGIVSMQQDQETLTNLNQVNMQTEVAKQTYDKATAGARTEDKLAANALVTQADSMVQAAKAQVAQAQAASQEVASYINDATITAPAEGVITAINTKLGELVSTGMPLIEISSTEKPWVEVKVEESKLGQISLGETVSIKLVAYSGESFQGKVVRINEKPDFATKRATNDNGEYDVLSYGVKIELDKMDKEVHPGMTALVDFGKLKSNEKAVN